MTRSITKFAWRWLPALAGALSCAISQAAPPLPALDAQTDEITVSGLSSGGYMAVQYQVAHSSSVAGAGVIAGGPYECAAGSTWAALTRCMSPNSWWAPVPQTRELQAHIERRASAGLIDPPADLQHDKVWVFSGGKDETLARAVVDALVASYGRWIPPASLRYVKLAEAGHAMVSVAAQDANACATSEPPYLNRCGDFDAAGELLAFLVGPMVARQSPPQGELLEFDQGTAIGGKPADIGLADSGYLFVPSDCANGSCRVHVAFHGCRQSADQIGTAFVTGAGYNEWASANRLIVLYPQTVPRYGWGAGSSKWVFNPRACWDWWGYTDPEYATRDGVQIRAVRAMVKALGSRQ